MPGADQFAVQLNDYLDRLVQAGSHSDPGIDAVAVTTIDSFFASDDAPPPPPGLADQVWETVMMAAAPLPLAPDSAAVSHANGDGRHSPAKRQPIPVAIWTGSASAAHDGRVASRARRWPSGFVHASSVLLLVLTLGLGFLALVLGRSPNPAVNAPGGVITAPTHPAVDMTNAETLLSLTLSSDSLPQTPERSFSPVYFEVLPGTTGAWLGTSAICCSGVRVDYVVDGAYTVRADGPIDARWADGRDETIPARTETVLGPGDSMLVPEGIGFTNANTGDAPVHVIGWYVHKGLHGSARAAGNWSNNRWHYTLDLPPDTGALTIEVHRVRLAPGAEIPAAAGSAQFAASPDETARLGEQSDGSYRNLGTAEITVYVLSATTASSDPSGDASDLESETPTHASSAQMDGVTLFSRTVPTALLRQGDGDFRVDDFDIDIPPGTQGTWQGSSGDCCFGVRIECVVEGAYTVHPDGPIEVTLADGLVESVSAGTEIVLGPGDSMFVPQGTGYTNANTGTTPVKLMG